MLTDVISADWRVNAAYCTLHTQLGEKPPAKFYKSSFCSGSAFNQRVNQQRRRRRRPIRSVRAQRHQYE